MKLLLRLIFAFFFATFLFYVLLPNQGFPKPIPGSVQSMEPADSETPLRRAYFTDFTRQETLEYYQNQFSKSYFLGIPILNYRLNYPPEDAQTLIRDQTRSTFLEEIVNPFRESVFVNGFEPKVAKDDVWYKGVHFRQKIIVRYVTTNIMVRIVIVILIALATLIIGREWLVSIKDINSKKRND